MPIEKDSPDVIAPPPLVFLSGLVCGGILTWFFEYPLLPDGLAVLLGNLLFLSGIGVIAVAFIQMRTAKTNIQPWKPTTAIIETGLYGYSRNPIYLALILVYLGLSLLVNSVWFLPFLPIIILVIHFGVILPEERYLDEKFGQDYRTYKKRIRRWI